MKAITEALQFGLGMRTTPVDYLRYVEWPATAAVESELYYTWMRLPEHT